MNNLAGSSPTTCDEDITHELTEAGVAIVFLGKAKAGEVPASVDGQLTLAGKETFRFQRAWYYWMVSGNVPLQVAQEMYENPIGKKDIRVFGDAGCPPPEQWAFPTDEVLKQAQAEGKVRENVTFGELANLCNSGVLSGERFVTCYHIDSQEGLNLLVATLRKHRLAD